MAIVDTIDLSSQDRQIVTQLLATYLPHTEVWAYGSRVTWKARLNSDLDLVAFVKPEQTQSVSALKEAFEESALPFTVDLHIWQNLPESFHQNIQNCYAIVQNPENKTLPQGWREVKLGDVVNFRRGHDLPKTKMEKGGFPVIGSNGIIGYHSEYTTKKPCVTVGRSGNVGSPLLTNHTSWAHNTTLYIDDFKGNNQQYIYYHLKTLNLDNYKGGSAVPTLNRNHIHPIVTTIPPLPEQKAIAHILGSLDDKIELNRQMNKTLENMAQALFKSWFVNFDPVIDNALKAGNPIPDKFKKRAENRQNHQQKNPLPAEIQNLFPSEFEHHEKMGWIPKGWEVVKLDNIVDAIIDNRGKTPPNDEKSKIPLVEVNAIKGFDRFFNKESVKKYVNIDIYNSWFRGHPEKDDVLISTVGSIGEIALVGNEIFCTAQNIIALKSKNKGLFLFELLKFHRKNIINLDISSVQPSIKVPHLLNIKILKPSNLIIEAYINKVLHLSKKIEINNFQNQTLTQLRDTLLPKLISGKIRVENVEKHTTQTKKCN